MKTKLLLKTRLKNRLRNRLKKRGKGKEKCREKYFGKRAKAYDLYIKAPVISKIRKDERRILNGLVDNYFNGNDSVLEIGCGTGYYTIYIARRCRDVTAIDLSEKMINIAGKKIRKKEINNITLKKADIGKTEFEKKFDKILCIGVLDYVNNKDAEDILKKCSELSYDTLILTAPNKSIFSRITKAFSKLTKNEYKYYTKEELKKALIDSGFKKINIYETGIKTKLTNGATLIAVAEK